MGLNTKIRFKWDDPNANFVPVTSSESTLAKKVPLAAKQACLGAPIECGLRVHVSMTISLEEQRRRGISLPRFNYSLVGGVLIIDFTRPMHLWVHDKDKSVLHPSRGDV